MPNRSLIPKVMAVGFSLLLAGAYVCHKERGDTKESKQLSRQVAGSLPTQSVDATEYTPQAPRNSLNRKPSGAEQQGERTEPSKFSGPLTLVPEPTAQDLGAYKRTDNIDYNQLFHHPGPLPDIDYSMPDPPLPKPLEIDVGGFESADRSAKAAPAPNKPTHRVFLPGSKSAGTGIYKPQDE